MKLPKEITDTWQKHYEHGDFAFIKRIYKIHPITAKRAIFDGVCSTETFKKVQEFYISKKKQKLKMIKSVLDNE